LTDDGSTNKNITSHLFCLACGITKGPASDHDLAKHAEASPRFAMILERMPTRTSEQLNHAYGHCVCWRGMPMQRCPGCQAGKAVLMERGEFAPVSPEVVN